MKKLILILILLFPVFADAQWIVQAINPTTGETKYITLPSGATGVNSVNGRSGTVTLTSNDVGLGNVNNTSDISKPISVATQNALNLKQNKLTAGSNISIDVNNVISATGGGLPTTYPITANLSEQTFLFKIKPFNYGVKYSDGTVQGAYSLMGYSTHNGVNHRTNRPDQVLLIAGYNVNANNGRTDTTDAAWDISVENPFDIPTLSNSAIEAHLFRIKTTKSKEIRVFSAYIDKVTGGGFINMETNSLSVFNPGYADRDPYFKTYDGQILLTNTTPGNSGTGLFMRNDASMGGQTIELHQRGGVGVFKIPANRSMGANYFLEWNSWNGLGLSQGFYNTNTEARAANLRPGIDTYWTRINGIKVLAQVE